MDPTALKAAAAVGVALVALIPVFNAVNEQQVDEVSVPDWLIPDEPPTNFEPPSNFKPPTNVKPPPDLKPPPDFTPPPGWQPPPGFGGCDPVIEYAHAGKTYEDPAGGTSPFTGDNRGPPLTAELKTNIGSHYFAHRVWINMTDFVGEATFELFDEDGRNHTFKNVSGPGMYKAGGVFSISPERQDPMTANESWLVYPPKKFGNWRLTIAINSPEADGENGHVAVDWEIGYCKIPTGGQQK